MAKIKLIGLVHGERNGEEMLMSDSFDPLIAKKVLPFISESSLAIVEGGTEDRLLLPGFPGYHAIHRQLGLIFKKDIRPIIYAYDVLYDGSKNKNQIILEHNKLPAYHKRLDDFLCFKKLPNTWSQLIKYIRNNAHAVEIIGELEPEWITYTRSVQDEWEKRDIHFAEQIKKYSIDKDIFFFAGMAHCVNLCAQYGWNVVRDDCSPKHIKYFYLGWYYFYNMRRHLPTT